MAHGFNIEISMAICWRWHWFQLETKSRGDLNIYLFWLVSYDQIIVAALHDFVFHVHLFLTAQVSFPIGLVLQPSICNCSRWLTDWPNAGRVLSPIAKNIYHRGTWQ